MHTLCGAPSGVTLSVDEMTAYVFCRSTHGVASVPLLRYDDSDPPAIAAPGTPKPPRVAYRDLAPDPLPEKAALGRRMFFNAADPIMSEGYSCNACHPEGRDDGHVWHQDESLEKDKAGKETIRDTRLHAFALTTTPDADIGVPRQTPMLAGRVSAGPYGWKAHSPSLKHRAIIGFSLHRWSGGWAYDAPKNLDRSEALVAFLRQGLVTPTRHAEPLTPERRAANGCSPTPLSGVRPVTTRRRSTPRARSRSCLRCRSTRSASTKKSPPSTNSRSRRWRSSAAPPPTTTTGRSRRSSCSSISTVIVWVTPSSSPKTIARRSSPS